MAKHREIYVEGRVISALQRAGIDPWIRLNGVRTAAVEIEVHLSDSDGPLGWAVWEDVVMAADQAADVEVTRVVEGDGTVVEEGIEHLEAFFAAMHRMRRRRAKHERTLRAGRGIYACGDCVAVRVRGSWVNRGIGHQPKGRGQMSGYNGWANYETWRVMLEVFDGHEDPQATADSCRETAGELVESTTSPGLARDLAMSFLAYVNWEQIAEAVKKNVVEDAEEDES